VAASLKIARAEQDGLGAYGFPSIEVFYRRHPRSIAVSP
jgi:hypothetical protein